MLKEHAAIYRKLTIFIDLAIVEGSFFLGYFLRDRINDLYPLSVYMNLLPILIITWGGLLYFLGAYESFRLRKIHQVLFIVFKAAFFGFLIFASYTYVFKFHHVSRIFIILTFSFATLFISLEKIVLIYFFRRIRKKGYNFRSILIVGTGKRAQRFIKLIHKHDEWGLKIVGLVDQDVVKISEVIAGHRVLGLFKDIPDIVHNNIVDEVIFVVPRSWLNRIEWILHFCDTEGLKASLAVDYFKLKFSHSRQTDLGEFPFLTFESTTNNLWHLLVKRLFDLVFSAVALFILAPVFIITAIIIKFTSKGSVFFRQKRCSLHGRTFTLYKFRTMVEDAEAKLDELLKYNEMNGPVFKMENDPRLTKIGKFLRKFSIDELPQLWNVFKGDMSLVGPRPPIPKEVRKYDDWERRRLSMRPGITCIWQTNGRNRIDDFQEWAKLDLEYIDNWSLELDFKILLRTIPAVLLARGAE